MTAALSWLYNVWLWDSQQLCLLHLAVWQKEGGGRAAEWIAAEGARLLIFVIVIMSVKGSGWPLVPPLFNNPIITGSVLTGHPSAAVTRLDAGHILPVLLYLGARSGKSVCSRFNCYNSNTSPQEVFLSKSSRHFHLDCLQPKQVQSNSLVPAQTNCQLFLQTHLCCSILCWVWRSVPDPLHSCLQNRQVCTQAADLQVAVKNKTTYHQEPSLFFVAPGVILLTRMNQFSHGFVWQSPNV